MTPTMTTTNKDKTLPDHKLILSIALTIDDKVLLSIGYFQMFARSLWQGAGID